MKPFAPEAWAEYERCFTPETIHASCEDYRAAAGIDLEHDRADRDAGRKVAAPLLALWGEHGIIGRCFEPIAEWQRVAIDVRGHALPSGHYIAEEVAGCPRAGARGILSRRQGLKSYRIAVIAGDGIGKEVVPEGMRVLEAAGRKFGFSLAVGREALELRVLREARRDDARGRPRADPRPRLDLPRRRGLSRRARPRVALGLADPDPPRLPRST